MSTTLLDIEAVRARFSALSGPTAFFDGPGGTQVPDEVIDAIADYLRHSNANAGGFFETSRRTDAVLEDARRAAASFVGGAPEEIVFGANMTSLNFTLTRTLGRELTAGDAILVTKLDHDANISPWLELAHDLGLEVGFVEIDGDGRLDVDDLERRLSERTRVVAFPWASNALGTLVEVEQVAALAREAGALAWVDAVHYAPHGPIDVAAAGVDVLICSPYKFYGPHLGLAWARPELLERWRPYKVRPAPDEPLGNRFETGTQPHELLAGVTAAIAYVDSLGWDAIVARERTLGERFLAGLPDAFALHGLPTMDGRVPTFAITHPEHDSATLAERLAEGDIAAWHGNYYALEVLRALGLEERGGALRIGVMHYNTAGEIDRLLDVLASV
ncbi:MAG TPA: cysteine desulfurase-like protein [Gaiellaceae bacterium]|nr:cysteine desulfurase-like protein [Gaiellaceae bacterium]